MKYSVSLILLAYTVSSLGRSFSSESELLSSISLQISQNDPKEILSDLKTSVDHEIQILNSDSNSYTCEESPYTSQISSLKSSHGMALSKHQKLSISLQKLTKEIQDNEKELIVHQSNKEEYTKILKAEGDYYNTELERLEKDVNGLEEIMQEIAGNDLKNMNLFIELEGVEEIPDSLQLLTKIKKSVQQSAQISKDHSEKSKNISENLLKSFDDWISGLQDSINNDNKLVKQFQNSIEGLEKEISEYEGHIKNTQKLLEEKAQTCQANKQKVDSELNRKNKQLQLIKQIIQKYESDKDETVKALKEGRLP